MTTLAVETMARHLTAPFARGAGTLALSLIAGNNATQADVAPYDFLEYQALFDGKPPPNPRYVLVAQQDIPVLTQVTVDYVGKSAATSGSVTINVPAGTLAGASFALDLNDHEEPEIRLKRVHMSPAAPDGEAANWWSLKALLGNLAKLLWVIGWEKNNIRRHLEIVQAQRHLPKAVKYSLDLLGYDLGVPRFPPQPYSFDPDTIALYHLDDLPASGQPEVDQVEDIMKRYGRIGHVGANTSKLARSGAVGRFGSAFAFRNPNAEIQIPSHAEFDNDSFTIECFVKPDFDTPDGEVLVKHAKPTDTTKVGWALSVGEFQRGLSLNTHLLLSDGSKQVTLFADMSLSSERFYHLAGVIDRKANEARLYVDGKLLNKHSLVGLGPLNNAEPIRIGRSIEAAYRGVIDEVRFSRVARSTFHPVLGEDDEAYRRRLELFEHWTLPTLPNLLSILNNAVGSLDNDPQRDPQPLILNDTNAAIVGGTLTLTVQPNTLAAGECIDAQGNRQVHEADVNGTATAETLFDPIYLVTYKDSKDRVIYAPQPARTLKPRELPPDPHKMQLVTEQRLNQLLDLLGASGKLLQVVSAFDPRASDLRAVGRGLLLATAPNTISPEQLAARAHRAGFSFVCNNKGDATGTVYVSTEPGDYIEVVVTGGTATSANGFDLLVNQTLNLGIRPTLPLNVLYHWLTIPCGAGRASFSTRTDHSTVTLTATAPGTVNVKAEVIYRQSRVAGTKAFRIGLVDLADGASISDDGAQGVSEDIAGELDDFFHPVYLVTHDDPRATYGNDVNNRRMQPSVAQRLNQLLTFIAGRGVAGQLEVVQAYVPNASGLPGAGRAITVRHPTLSPGTLGVLAHAAGFTYVRRQGNQIFARQHPDELVSITGPQEVVEKASISLAVHPRAAPHGIAVGTTAVYVTSSGTDTVSEIDPNTGQVRRAIKVGWGPNAVALSPDGKSLLYTADSQGNTITAVDASTGNILSTLAVGHNPVALMHHPTTQRLYVACQGDNSLLEIDTSKINTTTPGLSILNTLVVGSRPTGMALTPDDKAIWVALNGANQISTVGTSPFAVVGNNISLTAAPLRIAIAPNGGKAYATLPDTGSLAILDVAARNVTATVKVGQAGTTSKPNAVAVSPDSATVYVTNLDPIADQDPTQTQGHLLHLLKADGSPVSTIRVRREPLDVAVSSNHVYVVNRGSDEVSVIGSVEKALIGAWRLGSGLGEYLTWVLRPAPAAKARLLSITNPVVSLVGDRAGPVLLRAVYALRDNAAPYTFEVRLKPALEKIGTITVRKEQYDLLMNILNTFHPIGVEVITSAIRDRVIEVRDQLLSALPDYTYPNFRVRGPLPRRARKIE